MVVGQQDLVETPAAGGEGVQDRQGLGGIDEGGVARRLVMQQVGVVVGQAGDGDKFEGMGAPMFQIACLRTPGAATRDRGAG